MNKIQNPDGTFDGAAILAKLSGTSREDALKLWEKIKAQHARTDACSLHQLLPTGEKRKQWRCGACGWEPEAGAMLAYEQGLRHGRQHETGGGRE